MAYVTPSNRWWESYLIRYFMPSIAGVVIVGWLSSAGSQDMKNELFFGLLGKELSTPILSLLLLYGNLFCYIASYPILGFHATRVIDYNDAIWHPSMFDGYLWSLAVGSVSLIIAIYAPPSIRLVAAFILVVLFSIVQLVRIYKTMERKNFKGLVGKTSIAYGYVYKLAKRRGNAEKTTTFKSPQQEEEETNSPDEVTTQKTTYWEREVIDTYRHMREHGNSAFIFFLELVLASLCYLILSVNGYSTQEQLSVIGILFAIWALPAVAVHMFGQILERRFSLYTPLPDNGETLD